LLYTVDALGEVQEQQYGYLGKISATVQHATGLDAVTLPGLQGGMLNAVGNADVREALSELSDANDSMRSFEYDDAGMLASSTDALGNQTTYEYDSFGELAGVDRVVGAEDRYEYFNYDRRGLLTDTSQEASTGNAFTETSHEYDAFRRVVWTTDGNFNSSEIVYDRLGRVVQTVDREGYSRFTTYDAFDRVLMQTNANGDVVSYSYDRTARSVTVLTPEGIQVTAAHDRLGQTHSITDGNGNTTTYAYDGDGNLVETDTPLTTTSAQYDAAGRLLHTVDANGVSVEYAYDAANRVLSRTVDPDGLALTVSYGYDAKGQQVSYTDANGVVTLTGYDLEGHVLTQTVDPDGLALTTSYSHDATGAVLTVTSPGGTAISYVYDGLGQRIEEHVDPDGLNLTTSYVYDGNGNVVGRTDPNGHYTAFTYDPENRLTSTEDDVGPTRWNEYDNEGQLVRTYIANGGEDIRATDYTYDRDGRLVYQVDPAGGVTKYVRDANGNVIERITYAETIRPLVQSADEVISSEGDLVVRTTYDALNRAVWTIDGAGSVSRNEYDGNGNVVLHVTYATRDEGAWSPESPTALEDPAHDLITRTVYDAGDRAIFVLGNAGGLVASAYDANGNVIDRVAYAQKLPAGSALAPQTASGLAAVAASLADAAHDEHTRCVYDSANRLTWSVDGMGAVTGQRFDANGNLVAQIAYATPIAANASPDSVQGSADDRVTLMAYNAANEKTWQVDALGGVTWFEYNQLGELTRQTAYEVTVPVPQATDDATALVSDIENLSNPEARRITQTVYDFRGRVRYTVDPEGAVVETRYDTLGDPVTTIAYAQPVDITQVPGDPEPEDAPLEFAGSFSSAGFGEIVQSNPADRVTLKFFDNAHRERYEVDAMGYVSESTYDGAGQLMSTTLHAESVTDGSSPSLTMSIYDVEDFVRSSSDDDRTETFEYDAGGNLVATTDAMGGREQYVLDGLGNRILYTNKNGDTWTYEYDAAAHLTREIAPEVQLGAAGTWTAIVTEMGYDALGNLLWRKEAADLAEERTTSYEYDALGRQVRTNFPPVNVYDPSLDSLAGNGANGLAVRTEQQNVALYTRVTYDIFGDAVANRDVAGNYSYKVYDRLGQVTADIDAMGYVSGYERDVFGETTAFTRYANAVVLPATGATQEQVQAALPAAISDGGRTILTMYDRRGLAVQVTEPTVWVNDGSGGAGRSAAKQTVNEYDAFGDVIRSTVSDGSAQPPSTRTFYNRRGEMVGTLDELGYLTTQSYDAAGNVLKRTEYANSFVAYSDDQLPLGKGAVVGPGYWTGTLFGAIQAITSGASNPAGTFTFGWKSEHGSDVFNAFDQRVTNDGIEWTDSSDGTAPYVAVKNGALTLDAGANGEVAVVRWTVPVGGLYAMNFHVVGTGTGIAKAYVFGTEEIGLGDWGLQTPTGGAYVDFEIGPDENNIADLTGVSLTLKLVESFDDQSANSGTQDDGSTSPNASIDDRTTLYQYDKLNRLTSETRKNVEYSVASDGSAVNDHGVDSGGGGGGESPQYRSFGDGLVTEQDLVTTYTYDAVGNLLTTTDSLGNMDGGSTFDHTTTSEYDALGRVIWVQGPGQASDFYRGRLRQRGDANQPRRLLRRSAPRQGEYHRL
jgi:YD repeat-containing protein